jgi:cardiolipin synthase
MILENIFETIILFLSLLFDWWATPLLLLFYTLYTGATFVHVIKHKEESDQAMAWLGVVIAAPFMGATLYWIIGVNRIKRKVARRFLLIKARKLNSKKTNQDLFQHIKRKKWVSHCQMGAKLGLPDGVLTDQLEILTPTEKIYTEIAQKIGQAQKSINLSSLFCAIPGRLRAHSAPNSAV